jgi:paraquat-inducible protein B
MAGEKIMSGEPENTKDHGRIVRRRGRVSWAWVFPLIALAAAAWMYAGYVRSLGPEIEIRFTDAPGIEAGKTPLIFRGVVAGRVTRVDLDEQLSKVLVTVRLEKFAAGLAVDTSDFWIDRPVVSLQGVSGLTSLIQGNSLQARMGTGPRRTEFAGLDSSPVIEPDETALTIRLRAEEGQTIERGAPVTFRGVVIGRVRTQSLDEQGQPGLDIDIEEQHGDLVRESSRFWVVPATQVTLGPGGIELAFGGLDSLVQGSVAFDDFGVPGGPVTPGTVLPLLATERLARAAGSPFVISFPTGRGLRAGHTMLVYLGTPVGVVTEVRAVGGKVEAVARLEPAFERLRSEGSKFSLVEPQISLQGVTGLQTLLTGVVIDCVPGFGAAPGTRFAGVVPASPEEIKDESSAGLQVRLLSSGTPVGAGASVLYRDMQVGVVLSKELGADGKSVELLVGIEERYAPLVRQNSVFWEERGLQGSIGFLNLRVESAMPVAGAGVVKFATPDVSSSKARPMATYTLNAKPRREWLKWDPAIPLVR